MQARFVTQLGGTLAALAGSVLVLSRLIFSPEPLERPLPKVIFPSELTLQGWPVAVHTARTDSTYPDLALPQTVRQQYRRGNEALEVELQFIPDLPTHYVRNSDLELRFLPRGHLPLDAALHFYVNSRRQVIANLRDAPPSDSRVEPIHLGDNIEAGFWTTNKHCHLSAIVTPSGDTAMTPTHVAHSQYFASLNASRALAWLVGSSSYPDRRCVLIHLSTPSAENDAAEAKTKLQDAWLALWQTFTPAFPAGRKN